MIRVDSIRIREFRGIRDLTLDFNSKNFAICGPNGTGKSGVVDALEFALTGNVSRLSGEGRGDVSLRQHGPHVDRRNDPDKARVTVVVTIPSLSKTVTIERSLKSPTTANVTPRNPAVDDVLEHVRAHPEIVLSRRELIKYVLATPGKRAEEVQALLHLDHVERVRAGLQKLANSYARQLTALSTSSTQARDNLMRALEVTELTPMSALAAANAQRATLSLPALQELTKTTSLKDGLATPAAARPQRIPKSQALADIRAAREALAELAGAQMIARVREATADITVLSDDPLVSAGVLRETFYATGLELIESDACPLCDVSWDLSDLKRHVQVKIANLRDVALRRRTLEAKIAPLVQALRNGKAAIDIVVNHAALAIPPIDVRMANAYCVKVGAAAERLVALLPFNETVLCLASLPIDGRPVLEFLTEFEKAVSGLPEQTRQDTAREWLTVAQERLEVWRDAKRKQSTAANQAQRARQVSDIYSATSDSVLGGLYADVQNEFASLYHMINSDEEEFKAQLVPSMGRLGFDVDFYGRGFFPPGAYHSEGHQDGMGLCLYLALMRYLEGSAFTLAVLDDVLMSVDAGHRREVCSLLKREFPNTQFIMTTHDPIWLRHMRTEGLLLGRASVDFRTWSVDVGPTRWDDRDVWTEIGGHLERSEVRAASALLRHYLEYVSTELCHKLRAPVAFRGDARYQLGELMPAAIAWMRKLHKTAKDAANSWNQGELIAEIGARLDKFSLLADASMAEVWQVNVAVHYNNWDNLTKEDFTPVAEAFRNLLSGFACSDCGEYLRVSPEREAPEMLRCECGKTSINLCKKTA